MWQQSDMTCSPYKLESFGKFVKPFNSNKKSEQFRKQIYKAIMYYLFIEAIYLQETHNA